MPTSVRLPDDIERRLDVLARQTGRTKAFYIRALINEHLAEMEDYYLAAEVRQRVRKGDERVLSAKAVRRDLGLAD
ncbi:MAG: ribbon-helix-helix protein, CopG family [Rhodospirillales bacterium]|nr:ribbon-helix-helix protein, CopG family [Rhodospirillales bacterium]